MRRGGGAFDSAGAEFAARRIAAPQAVEGSGAFLFGKGAGFAESPVIRLDVVEFSHNAVQYAWAIGWAARFAPKQQAAPIEDERQQSRDQMP